MKIFLFKGGDVLTEYEMNTTYIPLQEGWYEFIILIWDEMLYVLK